MAGPGIRYSAMARILAQDFQTTLAAPAGSQPESLPGDFERILYSDETDVERALEDVSLAIVCGDLLHRFPALQRWDGILVIDGYDPLLAEWLALSDAYPPDARSVWWRDRMKQLTPQYLRGDFFICASERQRDWWLGLLEASGRIDPPTYARDPSLRSLLDVVPFGLPADPPRWKRSVFRSVWPGIGPDDWLLLWGGGLWPWLDPLTAVEAMALVHKEAPDIKLLFPGTRHPNPEMAELPTHTRQAIELAGSHSILDKAVYFGEWIPFDLWPSALIECNGAISLHYDTLETRLAYRTRILDYIWAGLPTVATRGDATADLIQKFDLGLVVGYENAEEVAESILRLRNREPNHESERWKQPRSELSWERALEPLRRFCENPQRSAPTNPGNPFFSDEGEDTAHVGKQADSNDSREPSQEIRTRKQSSSPMSRLNRIVSQLLPNLPAPPPKDVETFDVSDHLDHFDPRALDVIQWTPAWLSRAERLMIFSLIFGLRPRRYLEIGTFQGGSALVTGSALDAQEAEGHIYCVDPNPKVKPEHWAQIEHRATLFTGYSPDILPQVFEAAGAPFDFIFIDGDHSYEGVLRDARGVMPYTKAGTFLLFHDSFFPGVARGLEEFAREERERLIDVGPITREVTRDKDDDQAVPWGGLHLMQVRG